MKHKRGLALLASAAMAFSSVSPAFTLTAAAEEAVKKYVDDTYTATATVVSDDESNGDFDYDITVSVTVSGGVISDLSVTKGDDRSKKPTKNDSYLEDAAAGIKEQVVAKSSESGGVIDWDSVDAVSDATYSSNSIKAAAQSALTGKEAPEATATPTVVPTTEPTATPTVVPTTEPTATPTVAPTAEPTAEPSQDVYVLMNIPYDEFYAAEIENDVKVDAVSSSTKSKTKNTGLVAGSYHVNSDGSDITGITYPVKVSDSALLAGLTKVESSDDLFENVSYAYTVLSTVPSYYKEVTAAEDGALSFGAVQGEVTALADASADITDQSNYGDYQIGVEGLPDDIGNVSAVVLKTKEGASYGLRHLENIWRKSELAFSTGFVTTAHGNTLSYDHYKAIMGQTITEIEYITDSAVYTISTELYVPVRTGSSVAIADGASGDGSVDVTFTDLPEGYEPEFTANGLEVTYVPANGEASAKLTYTGAAPASYNVTVTDKSGKYASMKASFTLSTTEVYAKYNEDANAPALVAAQDDDNFSAYLKNLSSVTVDGTSYSASGRGAVALFRSNGYLDITAKPFSDLAAGKAYAITVSSTGYPDVTFTYTVPETIYAYASLSYVEYWAAEGVVAAGSTESSDELDAHSEHDKGAFDAVSRATTNHGLHRGSFQQVAVIHTTTDTGESKDFAVASWTDKNTIVLTDGSSVTFNKGTITYKVQSGRTSTEHTATMTSYEITGIKYVPVAIPANEFVSFAKAYTVTVNGDEISGGFSENNLQAYSATAMVTASTNGLKAVSASGEGYAFGARRTGTDSGILGAAQSVVTDANITKTLKEGDNVGNYGEFIRIDLTNAGDANEYGALGDKMQTVLWTYYGADSTYTTPVAAYGTKFAADNWMHKAMGIQLGLTDSIRAALPEGTDGTGYWSITVYALGYADYTYQFEATADNINHGEEVLNGWVTVDGKDYWYEDGVKQGTEGRGKEIYDPDTDAWYWLDAVQDGAKAVSKDVYQESSGGKWCRYDADGKMVKGWDTNENGTYYFDPITGAMAKGEVEIDGVVCTFDEVTGIGVDLPNLVWVTIDGKDYWYENGQRQGTVGRGKEIYDPASDAWYWLDAVQDGAKAVSKDVYQESDAGEWAENEDGTGKWVRYDADGHMVKGWDKTAEGTYYFDPIYGTMAKGTVEIDGKTYTFDAVTGILA